MYQVFFDQYPLHDLRDDELVLREPEVHLAVGESGSVAFTIDPDHPNAGRLTRLRGTLKLRADGQQIFMGRIRKDTRDFDLTRRIEVEGLLSCLNDSVIPPFDFPADFLEDAAYKAAAASGNVVAFFLGWVLGLHNSQVGPAQQIRLGTVTVADPNNYISRASSEYLTAMEVVRKKLEDLMGGYLVADYSGETTVLHYYDELPLTNIQEVRYGENLLDLISEIDAAETCTAVLPIGADGLTLAGLPDGDLGSGVWKQGRIVYSKTLEDELGGVRITHTVKMDDVTLATNLRSKAIDHLLTQGVRSLHTLEIRAADLGPIENLPSFVVGRNVHLYSEQHGFEATFPLMVLEPNILDPGETEITLGSTVKAASDISHAQQNATQEQLDQQRLELNKQVSSTQTLTQQQNDLAQQQNALSQQQTTLGQQQASLYEQHQTLVRQQAAQQEALNAQQQSLNTQQQSLNTQQQSLNTQQQALGAQQEALNKQQADLTAQQEELNRQQEELNTQQTELDAQQEALDQQRKDSADAVEAVRESMTEAIQDSEKIMLKAMENYVETSAFSEYQRTVTSEFEQVPGQINLKFAEAEKLVQDVDGDLQQVKQEQQKHFEFTVDGLVIKAGDQSGAMQLKLDNNVIRFMQDGREFGWWDGINFHTGNIYIDVQERAQFNTFAAVPRNKGNLSWLKVK